MSDSAILEMVERFGETTLIVAPERIVDQRPNPAKVIQSCDVFVDMSGIMYLTDTNAGLYILQYEGR